MRRIPSFPGNLIAEYTASQHRTITVVQAKSVAATICDSYYGIGHNFLLTLVKTQWSTINALFSVHICSMSHFFTTMEDWCNSSNVVQSNLHSSCPLPTNTSLVLVVTGEEEEGSCKICFCHCQWSFTRGYLLWEHWALHYIHQYTRYRRSGPGPGECWGWVGAGSRTVFCRYIGRWRWLSLIWLHCSLLHFIK